MKIVLPSDVKREGYMTVLVFGGRDFKDTDWTIYGALDEAHLQCRRRGLHLIVVQGGATGADRYGHDWAQHQMDIGDDDVTGITEAADWNGQGRSAGPKRNQLMIDKYQPDYFIAMPGGSGTADMARRCKKAKIPGLTYLRYGAGDGPSPEGSPQA